MNDDNNNSFQLHPNICDISEHKSNVSIIQDGNDSFRNICLDKNEETKSFFSNIIS